MERDDAAVDNDTGQLPTPVDAEDSTVGTGPQPGEAEPARAGARSGPQAEAASSSSRNGEPESGRDPVPAVDSGGTALAGATPPLGRTSCRAPALKERAVRSTICCCPPTKGDCLPPNGLTSKRISSINPASRWSRPMPWSWTSCNGSPQASRRSESAWKRSGTRARMSRPRNSAWP